MAENRMQTPILVQPEIKHRGEWEQLAQKEKLDFEALELSLPPALNQEPACREFLSWYRSTGLTRAVHGAFMDINVASNDMEICRISMERCRESCRLTASLGAERVVFHSSAYPYLDDAAYLDRWAGRCAEVYLSLAEEFHLTICIENCLDQNPNALRRLMERTNSRQVRVCLDLGHVNYSHTPLELWFHELEHEIGCLHLSDNLGSMDEHLPLGDGTVDWPLAQRLWAELDHPVPLTLEVGSLEGVVRSLHFLRENHYFGLGGIQHDR